MDRDVLLDERAAAEFLGLQPNTLSVWRSTRRYPLPWVRVGSRVRYRMRDLEEFVRAHTAGADSEQV
jgi:hypothetical protein